MVLSLGPLESQTYEHEPSQPNKTINRNLPTTSKMVEKAVITLHTAQGFTLKQIYKYILTHYNLESLSKIRITLIKKHIISLRESGDIINKTGKGFVGHLKLVDRAKFLRKFGAENSSIGNSITTRKSKKLVAGGTANIKNVKKKNEKPSETTKKIASVVNKGIKPPFLPNNNASIFDTPLVPTQVHASTPFTKNGFVPQAPEAKKRNRKALPMANLETPRSSLPKKRKKSKLHRAEKV